MHDLPVPHNEGTHYRRESAAKPKEMKPLLTREPLPHDREKKPAPQPPKKRKRAPPTKPLYTFDPTFNHIPSGRQDPPTSPPIVSGPSASESLTSPYDEHQTTPLVDREMYSQSHDGYDAQKRPRALSECPSVEHPTLFYPDTPYTDANDMNSVPPPAPSDQSPCAAEYVAYACQVPPPMLMYPYVSQGYGQPPVIHQDSYGYPMDPCPDRTAQGYPVQHFNDAAHGRAGPYGVPGYPESNIYPSRRF